MTFTNINFYLKNRYTLLLIILLFIYGCSSDAPELNITELKNWEAGTTVTIEQVDIYGKDNCFQALEISDKIFSRIYGLSYKVDCTIAREYLRYIKALHKDNKGRILIGEMIVNKAIADNVVEVRQK